MDLDKIKAFKANEKLKEEKQKADLLDRQNAKLVANTVAGNSAVLKKAIDTSADKIQTEVKLVAGSIDKFIDALKKHKLLPQDASGVIDAVNSLKEVTESIPKQIVIPKQQKIDAVSVKNQIDYTEKFNELVEAFSKLEIAPEVNVSVPDVKVPKIDVKPITEAIDTLKNSLDNLPSPEVNVDLNSVKKGLSNVVTTLKSLKFPVPNYVLPFMTDAGKATQVKLDSSGQVPITGTVTVSGGGDGTILDGVTPSIKATVADLTNSNPLAVEVVDASGTQITSFGGGTQYADGAVRGTGTGTIAMVDDGTNIQTLSGDSTGKLNVNNISGTVSLPTGAATAALQTTGNTSLSSLDTKLPAQGQALAAASTPVVLTAAQVTTLTPPAAITGYSTSAIQTDGTQKSVVRGGAKGATTAADITSTSQSVDRNALDVQIRTSAGAVVDSFGGDTSLLSTAARQDTQITSLQLLDDVVATLGTTTYTEATTKGNVIGAVRRDADTTLVNTTNEVAPLQVDANGRLKVEAFSGETLPVSLTSTTITGTVTVDGSASTQPVKFVTGGGSSSFTAHPQSIIYTNSTIIDAGAVIITLSGTYAGLNFAFEGTTDGSTYFSIQAERLNGKVLETTSGVLTNTSRSWRIYSAGLTQVKLTTSAFTSGTASIVMTDTHFAQPYNDYGGGVEASALRVTIANDSTGLVSVDDNGGSLTVDYATTGSGTATGALRVELPTNGTGVVGLNAGTALIGKVGIDQVTANANEVVTKTGSVTAATLSAETTKVIGTVNIAAAQTLATVTTVGAVTAITNALPVGTNNIGDVDVLTVPADPFGVNADAASATGSISAKLKFIASTGIPITGTVTVNSHAVTNAGTFAVQNTPVGSPTPTLANVAGSASSVTVLASNANRKSAIFYNDSSADCYLKYGTTASTTSFTYLLPAYGTLSIKGDEYSGRIDGIWTSATGNMRVTETVS